MEIANIFSIENQKCYENEKMVMILAHLLDKYKITSFIGSHYVIMDNGMFENSQVSTNLIDLICMAEQAPLLVDEIIIPDKMHDLNETIKMFEDNYSTIELWNKYYRFMFVAQHSNFEEFKQAIEYINQCRLDIVVGIPKWSKFDRSSQEAIEVYKKCRHPIHFLGLTKSLKELIPVKDVIRSCDTSQAMVATKYHGNETNFDLLNYERDDKVETIDLLNDRVGYKYLRQNLSKIKEYQQNGIL